jgi:hypothetical protein
MFVHGSKDAFGSPEEMGAALRLPPTPTSLVILDRAGHDLRRGQFDFASIVLAPFLEFIK